MAKVEKEEVIYEPELKKQKLEEKVVNDDTEATKIEENKNSDSNCVAKENNEEIVKDQNGFSKNEDNEDTSHLEDQIIRQIEYYFGDANLFRDKFLLEQISKDSEGWVPFEVLLNFKRLNKLTKNVDVIINALNKSNEGLIEISEDKLKIRRHPERPIPKLNEEVKKEIQARTAYVKGFPLDMEMDELIDYFNQFKNVFNVVMRKYFDKKTKSYKFKGSVFITFSKKEECEEFINKENLKYNEVNLIRKWQEKYFEEKKNEVESYSKKNKKRKNEEIEVNLPKCCVLHFEGCHNEMKREDIKKALEDSNFEVAFIEFSKGDENGYIRLTVENDAEKFLNKLEENKLNINGADVKFRVLSGDEETDYLKKVKDQMISKKNLSKNKGGWRNKSKK